MRVSDSEDDETFCEIVVLEKPWLIRENQKFSEMTSNNCSLPLTTNDRFHYVVNQVFVNQKAEPANIDDQIVEVSTTTEAVSLENDEESTTEESTTPSSNLSGNSMNFLDNFFNVNNFLTTKTSSTTPPSEVVNETAQTRTVEQSQLNTENKNNENSSSEILKRREDLEIVIKKTFSELFQTDSEFQARIIALIHRVDDSELEENKRIVVNMLTNHLREKFEIPIQSQNQSVRERRSSRWNIRDLSEEALETLDHIDFDDNKRMLLNIIKVSEEEKGDKNLLRIEIEIANSKCQESSHEISDCEEKIDLNSKKICLLEVNIFVINFILITIYLIFLCRSMRTMAH